MILFLSKYPQTPEEFRDGFFQRIDSIDHFYANDERVYLDVSFFKNFRKNIVNNQVRTQIECNFFSHFFFILGLFRKASFVYIQSIYNAITTIFFIILFRKFYVLDLHGVVPEELAMKNKKIHFFIASMIEKILFSRVNICVAVTNKMVQHFKMKYYESNCEYITYAILPNHLEVINLEEIKSNETIEIIYSGNLQLWQNIDLMLEAIKKNQSEKIKFTILTGDPESFKNKMNEKEIESGNIVVKSVKPEELKQYYQKSNYGFVLRDDILVNRVACPTKIIEYLAYGIIPIVLSEKIGDFEDYGYEYLQLGDFNDQLRPCKSEKNIQVMKQVFENNNFNLKEKILKLERKNFKT